MANEPEKTDVNSALNTDEVSLENIDKILEENDPGFNEALNDVRHGAEETDVEIESIAIDEKSFEGAEAHPIPEEEAPTGLKKFGGFASFKMRIRNGLVMGGREFLAWLKVRPKEYILFLFSQIKALLLLVVLVFKKFGALPGAQKLAVVAIVFLSAGAAALIAYNLRGRWLPAIDKPLIVDFGQVADKTWEAKEERWVPLFQALRQPEHRYLFDKVVVNLKRVESAQGYTNPMGLFEFYVELDSKQTAIEVNDRKLELLDLLQRTIEGETYNSLSGETGKQRLKNLIRQEMNQVLSQGWVKDVYISNMVLKP